MELEFVTLADDSAALEKLPAEQGLTGCGGITCIGFTCLDTCANLSCLNALTCESLKSKITVTLP